MCRFYWDGDCHGRLNINITGCGFQQHSNATIEWAIGENETPGTYRITHYGHARQVDGEVVPYSGMSSEFSVSAIKKGRKKRWSGPSAR